MKLKATLAALGLTLMSAAASAQSFSTEAMTPGATPLSWEFGGSTDKSFSVTVPAGSFLASSGAFALTLFGSPLTFSTITLEKVGGSTVAFQKVSSTLYLFAGPVSAGDYFVNIDVNSAPSTVGGYSGGFTISAVPEPETYALMLAGLGAIGLMVRRRKLG